MTLAPVSCHGGRGEYLHRTRADGLDLMFKLDKVKRKTLSVISTGYFVSMHVTMVTYNQGSSVGSCERTPKTGIVAPVCHYCGT